MTYSVELISMEQKEELAELYASQVLYEIKAEIYGCCIKLLTGCLGQGCLGGELLLCLAEHSLSWAALRPAGAQPGG